MRQILQALVKVSGQLLDLLRTQPRVLQSLLQGRQFAGQLPETQQLRQGVGKLPFLERPLNVLEIGILGGLPEQSLQLTGVVHQQGARELREFRPHILEGFL